MIQSLKVENYRGFTEFTLDDLRRVNLLVGMNSTGKTSLLEAVQILKGKDRLYHLGKIAWGRREIVYNDSEKQDIIIPSASVLGFFRRSGSVQGVNFMIESFLEDGRHDYLKASFQPSTPTQSASFVIHDEVSELEFDQKPAVELRSKGISMPLLHEVDFTRHQGPVGTLWDHDQIPVLLESIMLTEEEERLVEALRLIDPEIERVYTSGRPQIYVKRRGESGRVPIGSLGDGMWRLLSIAMALVQGRGGYALLDDVDAGLHYSVMPRMWEIIHKTADRLDVQVFATTHSQDCLFGLGSYVEQFPDSANDVSLHRIEKGKNKSIRYDGNQVVIASEQGIEVR